MERIENWDDYFMSIAILTGKKSKDDHTKVGACIVDEFNRVVGLGYNGFPRNVDETQLPWTREGEFLETKYPYVVHAELNAILNSTIDLRKYNCKIYVQLFPCNECAKAIIQSGIKEVIYLDDKYHDSPQSIASRKLFDLANVRYRQYQGKIKDIEIKRE